MSKLQQKELLIALPFVIPLLLIQSIWIFKDAKKRGEKYYWLWGIIGILNVPESLIVYLIVTRIILKKTKKNK